MKEKIKDIQPLIIGILIAFCIYLQCNKSVVVTSPHQPNLIQTRNEKGQQVTITKVVQDVELIAENARLKKLLNKRVKAAITFDTKTVDSGATKTIVIHDTTTNSDEYFTRWSDSLSQGSILATKDTIYRGFVVFNKYDIQVETKRRIFGADSTFVKVTNLNPYTDTQTLNVFVKKEKKVNRFGWFIAGAVAMLLTVVLLK